MDGSHIIIGGCPRTGSTALGNLLSHQDNVFIFNEFGIYNHWNKPDKWKAFRDNFHFRSLQRNRKRLERHGWVLEDFCERIIKDRMTGQKIFEFAAKEINVTHIGDKCPLSYLARMIEHSKTFPNAKFIITMRDGRDVIDSQIRQHKALGDAGWMAPTIEKAEYLWLECAQRTIRNLRTLNERVFLWRYETHNFHALGKFLGVRIEHHHMFKPRSTWKDNHPDMMDKLSNPFKEMLRYFDYAR